MSGWDRAWFFLLGLLSTSAGVALLAWDRWVDPGRRIVGEPFVGWVDEPWFPVVVLGVGLVVALAGLAWLISQLRRNRHRADRFDVGGGPADAPVSVPARPAADAVAQQAERVPGVISAASRVTSDSPPTIELSLVVDDGADLAALTDRLGEQVRAGLRRTLGRSDAVLTVRIGLKHRKSGVVAGGTLPRPAGPVAGRLPQVTLTQVALPQVNLPQVTLPRLTLWSGHSAESSAATSSGTSTLA